MFAMFQFVLLLFQFVLIPEFPVKVDSLSISGFYEYESQSMPSSKHKMLSRKIDLATEVKLVLMKNQYLMSVT